MDNTGKHIVSNIAVLSGCFEQRAIGTVFFAAAVRFVLHEPLTKSTRIYVSLENIETVFVSQTITAIGQPMLLCVFR